MKSAKPEPIKEILAKTIKGIVQEGGRRLGKEEMAEAWKRAAGKEACRHSSPARIKGDVLVVNVDSPMWIYQLNTKRAEIEKKLNNRLRQKRPLSIRLRAGEE